MYKMKVVRKIKEELMSRTRWTLPAAERQDYLAMARRLRNGGCCIPIIQEETPTPSRLNLEQDGECHVLDLPNGGVGYVVWVAMTFLVSNVIVRDYQLIPPWGQPADFLPDPKEHRPPRDYYFLAEGLTYPRTQVLNHRLTAGPTFNKGDFFPGALIAKGVDMPEGFRNTQYVDLAFVIFDQFGNPESSQIKAEVDRSMRDTRERLVRRPQARSFSEPEQRPAEGRRQERPATGRPPGGLFGPAAGRSSRTLGPDRSTSYGNHNSMPEPQGASAGKREENDPALGQEGSQVRPSGRVH
jgi:hypothetical protein